MRARKLQVFCVPSSVLPVLATAWIAITLVVSFTLRFTVDPIWSYSQDGLPYISDTGTDDHGRAWLGSGLVIGALLFSVSFWEMFEGVRLLRKQVRAEALRVSSEQQQQQREEEEAQGSGSQRGAPFVEDPCGCWPRLSLRTANLLQVWCGQLASFFLVLTALISYDVQPATFFVFAFLQFTFFALCVLLERRMRRSRRLSEEPLRLSLRCKFVVFVLAVVGLGASLVAFGVNLSLSGDTDEVGTSRWNFWRHAGPVLQYFAVSVLFLNMFFYQVDFRRFQSAVAPGWARVCLPLWDKRRNVGSGAAGGEAASAGAEEQPPPPQGESMAATTAGDAEPRDRQGGNEEEDRAEQGHEREQDQQVEGEEQGQGGGQKQHGEENAPPGGEDAV